MNNNEMPGQTSQRKYKVVIYSHQLYADDILWGFTAADHEVQRIIPSSTEHFDRLMEEINPDLLILSSCMDYFTPLMLKHIGSRNSSSYQCVCWDTEGIGQYGLQMAAFETVKPDMVFSICPAMMEKLKSKGIPNARLDFAFNPTVHFPKLTAENQDSRISLVGNAWLWYANTYPGHFRYSKAIPILLKPLIEKNDRIDFYGTTEYKAVIKNFLNLDVPIEWFKGSIPYAMTCNVYNQSFANLITQNHELTVTRRTFEILGSGGFGLSCNNTAVQQMFGNGGGLAISNSASETLELLEYYRQNKDAYRKMRENAVVSVKNHTYKERAEEMIGHLF